ncbi:MAG: Maf family protein [Phycisphaerae bacterium]|nr:Maf family protein [Phycisphaerae bacterium]
MSKTNTVMGDMPLVYLASGSPRRRAILEELGIAYRLLAADVDEMAGGTACETAEENARRKWRAGLLVARASGPPTRKVAWGNPARSCLQEEKTRPRGPRHGGAVVVAADTVLEAQGRLLGKPADETMAREYLQMLSGGTAVAYSAVAVAVVGAGEGCLATETAEVHFKTLSPEVIRWYLSTGEPVGRAGAFGIGQIGEVLTESVDGCYSCVSGLPKTALLLALARVAGGQLPGWLRNVPASLVGARVQLRSLTIDCS